MPTIDLERVPQPLLYAGYVYDREFDGPGETAGWYWLSVWHYDLVHVERTVLRYGSTSRPRSAR